MMPGLSPDTFSHPHVFRLKPTATRAPAAFPLGLGQYGVHELCEDSFGDMAALTGFALAASRPCKGMIVWVRQQALAHDHGHVLAAGMQALAPQTPPILNITTRKTTDTLWATEEAIRAQATGLVIAELQTADFTASRRLTLASSRHGVPLILLMPYTRQGSTASAARWRIASRPSAPNRYDPHAPGHTRWHAALERCRRAPHMTGHSFNLELDNETLSLRVVTGLAANPVEADLAGPQNRPHAHKQYTGRQIA